LRVEVASTHCCSYPSICQRRNCPHIPKIKSQQRCSEQHRCWLL